jgi:predicted TIM-barrel fold metal-dependent hydrolase
MILTEEDARCALAGLSAGFLEAVSAHKLPLCVFAPDVSVLGTLAARHPDVQFIIDHMGLSQPLRRTTSAWPSEMGHPTSPPSESAPFRGLDHVLALAEHDNIAVKISGVPTLSRVPFPFADVWPHIHAVLNAFGADRCMWGTDWTRALEFLSYEQGVTYMKDSDQLSADEKEALLGRTLSRIYGWRV